MEYPLIEEQVKKIIADKLSIDVAKVDMHSSLQDDLMVDSFASIEIAFDLEEKFNIKIPDDVIVQVKVVKDIVDYISTRAA